ncbi:prephenate dehydratase [Paenibacillus sp. y28]|uniref:prephenate dehydratase n=1 Tax=Paenibacillus sp. y28 TaxID=3129110 RepID=UPI00301A610A
MKPLRVALLGPEGTVSQESAKTFLAGLPVEFKIYRLISEAYQSTMNGETDYSIIPIENTIEGSVNLHVDVLVGDGDLPIQAEWTYPSIQNLIGFRTPEEANGAPVDYSRIRKVASIPVAIAQCGEFLRAHLPDVDYEHTTSTAGGVRLVKESGDPGLAAIGTKTAADMYGLDLLAENVTDHNNNFTRFTLVGREPFTAKQGGLPKTTMIVTLPEDYPGALHQVLSAFAWRRINLSKIESRPTKKKLGNYYFYIDVEASLDSVLLPAAISEIEAIGCQVRILGSYLTYPYQR